MLPKQRNRLSRWMVCAIALVVIVSSPGHADLDETFEGLATTSGGWGGNANWSFSTNAADPFRANRFRSDVARALDIIDTTTTYTTPLDVVNPSASTTVANGPSLNGNRVIGDMDVETQGRGMVYHTPDSLTVVSFDWRGFGPSTWVQLGNASGAAFGFRLQSQNLEVNTFGAGNEIQFATATDPAVIQDNSDSSKTDWFTLAISIDHSPYTAPSGLAAPGSFSVDYTPKGGSTTALMQGGSPLGTGSVVGVNPADFLETSFPVNLNTFASQGPYDGGLIDTIWLYEEAGTHDLGGNPARADPAAVWDNFIPEPATGLVMAIATVAVAARRRVGG